MSSEAQWHAFDRSMDNLRREPRRIEPVEIARIAREAGLSPYEALSQIWKYERFGATRRNETSEALTKFVSALCKGRGDNNVLEYTVVPHLLTARLAESGQCRKLQYLTPHDHTARLTRTVFQNTKALISQNMTELTHAAFDIIVCSPPLGQSPSAKDSKADGFGGEVVLELAPLLAKAGMLCWVTGRGALFTRRAKRTFTQLESNGLSTLAAIDIAPGSFPGTMIEGAFIVFRQEQSEGRFVGSLRDTETSEAMASALLAGPSRKGGATWTWLDAEDDRMFSDIEHSRLLEKLRPRGNYTLLPLAPLLSDAKIERADRPIPNTDNTTAFLFVPEYAGSHVTVDLEEQTVKSKAVYRLAIDRTKANPRFLARLLNSPYGRQLRADRARSVTIQRLSAESLLEMELPIPDLDVQDRIARIDSDVGLLQAALRDSREALDQGWTELTDLSEKIQALKAVLDIERQIAGWWRELPYPLATIYRRYQVSQNPKDRLDALLHFFEMAAIYLGAIGVSHVRALRKDWQEVVANWLHPRGAIGIERADFGFWIGLTGASLKDLKRVTSDKELRESAMELAGPGLLHVASLIGQLGKATEVLDVARRHRNSWKGHGGHIKPSDAARLDVELQQSVRDLYEITASVFRRFQLVRPGMAEVSENGFKFQIENLSSSDPTFATEFVELDRPVRSRSLAFWMRGFRTMCNAVPFFRLGAPQQPQEAFFYVFNRVENGGFRWISYQEAREQEFIAQDDELMGIITLGTREN